MRSVVVFNLVGFCVAIAGLTFFGMAWPTAVAIWLLSGPIGVLVGIAWALTHSAEGTMGPAASPVR